MKLVAYIRGGLGDTWIALSALKPIIEKNQISKYDITLISDSVYYFREYPKGLQKYILNALHKVSSNVIMVSPQINNNFQLDINDVGDDLSPENAWEQRKTFMFWRPDSLKEFVIQYITYDTIFIDALFAECILQWDFKSLSYKKIGNERAIFKFEPSAIESNRINDLLCTNHIVLHTRKKEEGTAHTENEEFYNSIIKFCNIEGIVPIVAGIDDFQLDGIFVDFRGDTILSFEGMGYLIDKCKVLVGNDSSMSHMKLYQQQKDTLLIMNHNRFERSYWCKDMFLKSNCLLLDAKDNNLGRIKQAIKEYYENK